MTRSADIRSRLKLKPPTDARWKRVLQNAGLTAAVVVVLLSGVEIVLRSVFDGKYGERPAFFIPHPMLGWQCNSGLDDTFYGADFCIHVRTDDNGYRLGALGEVDFGKRLVLLAGDSNVFGWGVSTGETVASYLDGLVYDAAGREARVVNLGVGGYGTLQYFVRLQELLEKHPDARIAAVIVVHAPNDAVDNVNSVGYYFGAWKPRARLPGERSPLHLVNLVAYAVQVVKERRATADRLSKEHALIHPYLQDMSFAVAVDTELPKTIHPEITLNGRTISFTGLTEDDWSAEKTFARASLTEIQREMMSAAVGSIHALLAGRETRILHVVVPTAPDWFVDGVSRIVRDAAPNEENGIGFYGRLLDADQYGGEVLNDHSGGHYTPVFNRSWAEKIMGLLRDQRVELSKS